MKVYVVQGAAARDVRALGREAFLRGYQGDAAAKSVLYAATANAGTPVGMSNGQTVTFVEVES